jgi:hypothetical protein
MLIYFTTKDSDMRSIECPFAPARSPRHVLLGGFCIVLALNCARAQTDPPGTAWFPSGTLFTPLIANHEEPRMGLSQEIGNTRMKVAIGNALDVYEYRSGADTLRASALFFAYALANDYRGYRLKIDAADGFFGIGFSYNTASHWSVRFRILHLSAHLVDGHYNDQQEEWRDGKLPFPFSRNYGEIVGVYQWDISGYTLRPYAGIAYAPIVKPVAIRKWSALAGWEAHAPGTTHLYLAHHFTLMGTPTVIGSNTVEAGIKFGRWNARGLRLFLTYQNGWDNFGEYYNVRHEAVAGGFAFDFWE